MKKLFLSLLLLLSAACSEQIPAEIAPARLKETDLILDVRTDAEHKEVSLDREHWLVPLQRLDAKEFIKEHALDGSKPLYILCRSGKRAKTAADMFKAAGFKKVVVIKGGIIAAEQDGLKIKHGEK